MKFRLTVDVTLDRTTSEPATPALAPKKPEPNGRTTIAARAPHRVPPIPPPHPNRPGGPAMRLNQAKARNQLARDPGRFIPCGHPERNEYYCSGCLGETMRRAFGSPRDLERVAAAGRALPMATGGQVQP